LNGYLLDTHLLLWAVLQPARFPQAALELLDGNEGETVFSAASIWEVAIKASLGRADFTVDPRRLRDVLVSGGFRDLAVTSVHGMAAARLPPNHGDPFDRMLLAQAEAERLVLLTSDRRLTAYPGPVRFVG
jgi:PIN domain nuclease of toxin-antitoxin system